MDKTASGINNCEEQDRARLTIGMPVYNGENFVAEAIESILGQKFKDFRLTISDNGSTDGTENICRRFAAIDERIEYLRSDENRGAAWNFNRLVALCDTEYFMWASHDDLWSPEYLLHCVSALDRNPTCALCYTRTSVVNDEREVIKVIPTDTRLQADSASRRFAAVWRYPPQVLVFGVIRTGVLKKTRLIGSYSSSDRVLAVELALQGPFVGLDKLLFSYRRHGAQSTGNKYVTKQSRGAWYDPKLAGKLTFPHWRLLKEYCWSISKATMSPKARCLCFCGLLEWIVRARMELLRNLVLRDRQHKRYR